MSYLPVIDHDACAAHGECVEIAPEIFALGETADVVGSGPDDLILAAAEACPSLAISVVDTDTGETIFP
jgi:ferredoxin